MQRRPLGKEAIARALAHLHGGVRARGLKQSKVRDDIARVALSYQGHFGVDDLVRALHDRGHHNIHAATVYRTVPLLHELHLIEAAPGNKADGQRYESGFEREHHDHLVCTQCGAIVEFRSETLETLQLEIAERHGFVLDDHVHELRGRCRTCRTLRSSAS